MEPTPAAGGAFFRVETRVGILDAPFSVDPAPMKLLAASLLLGLAVPLLPLAASRSQDGQETPRPGHPLKAFQKEQSERFAREIQGAWMLVEYDDPEEPELRDGVEGFAIFHDGFLTMILQLRAFRSQLLGSRDQLFVDGGAYRYRFADSGDLQTVSLMGFTNLNNDAQLLPLGGSEVDEYIVTLDDGLLGLRNTDDVLMTFRRVEAGEFPRTAIRRLEQRFGAFPPEDVDTGEDEGDF